MPARPDPPPSPRSARGRRRIAAGVVIAVSLFAALWWVAARLPGEAGPLERHGAPLYLAGADGGALYLLTSHTETHTLSRGRRSGPATRRTERHVDLWRFDPATARPVWRRRLGTAPDGGPAPMAILGADGGTLWLHARGLRAVRTADGAPVADEAALEARNPALAGLLPRAPTGYALGDGGLHLRAADGRVHRVDAATLAATRVEAPPPAPVAARPAGRPAGDTPSGAAASPDAVVRPALLAGPARGAFQVRGLAWPGRWLGLLTDEEAAALAAPVAVPGAVPGERRRALEAHVEATRTLPPLRTDAPLRYRLWGARVATVSAAPPDWPAHLPNRWGTRERHDSLAPLPASPEFLQGGLLAAGGGAAHAPIALREPDGVLVLHRDRIDEDGRLRLTRVAGPDGRVVWEAPLPLAALLAVVRAPDTITLLGLEPAAAPDGRRRRDPRAPAAWDRIVAVELATGAVHAYHLQAEGPAQPLTSP